MNNPKWHLNNLCRIQDVKNTHHPTQASLKPTQNAKRSKPLEPAQQAPVDNQYETRQLRNALCEAIEENEFLRDRVIELEALLAEAQYRIETV